MDHSLPGMQGIEAVQRIRTYMRTGKVPVIMYTSQSTAEFARHARAAGADDIILKTDDLGKLESVLCRHSLLPGVSGQLSNRKNIVHPDGAEDSEVLRDLETRIESLIEGSLERHRDRLRQDLLAEFAILERYEERMRLELARRIEVMTNRALTAINETLAKRDQLRRQNVAQLWRSSIIVAAFAITGVLGLFIGYLVYQA
jgi:CheY-like chemotaxis protein